MPAPGSVDKALQDALKRAKRVPTDRPYFFALVIKGGAAGKLLVAKKKIKDKEIAAAKKETGGSAVVRGVCFGEDGQVVFETAKVPAPAWTALAKKLAKEDAGLVLKVLFRHGRDDEQLPDEFPGGPEDEAAEDESEDQQENEPAPLPVPDAAKRFAALSAAIKTALQAKGPNAPRIQALAVAVTGLLKNDDAAQANKVLDELEPLLAPATPPKAPPQPPPPGGADAAKRLNSLGPAIKSTLAAKGPDLARIQSLFAAAGGLLKNGDAAQANKVLDELEPLLKPAAPPSLAGWMTARGAVVGKLKEIAKEIAAAKHAESAKALIQLNAVIKNLTPEPATRQQVAELVRYVETDDVVADVSDLADDIRTPLLAALAGLSTQLPA